MMIAASLIIGLTCMPLDANASGTTYVDDAYRQLVTEKGNAADITLPEGEVSGYDILAELVKIDDENNLYDGAMLRNRGNWVVLKQGSSYKLVAENAYDIDVADRIATEIADEVKSIAGDDATDRELFYEYLRYMEKNFHYSREVSKNTQYMNKNGAVIDNDNFTDTYYTDKGLNCVGYAVVTYLVANKLGAKCELIDGAQHLYNAVKFSDSDKYVTFDLTMQNKYAGLGTIGNMIIKIKASLAGEKQKKLTKACNQGKEYSPAGITEFFRELSYYHTDKAEQ